MTFPILVTPMAEGQREKRKGQGSGPNDGMQELVKLMNKLSDVFASAKCDLKLKLPMIAVIGGQSTGKSSVLEGIAGRYVFYHLAFTSLA